MAGYQEEILPSSWSHIVKYTVYNINSEVQEYPNTHQCRQTTNIK